MAKLTELLHRGDVLAEAVRASQHGVPIDLAATTAELRTINDQLEAIGSEYSERHYLSSRTPAPRLTVPRGPA